MTRRGTWGRTLPPPRSAPRGMGPALARGKGPGRTPAEPLINRRNDSRGTSHKHKRWLAPTAAAAVTSGPPYGQQGPTHTRPHTVVTWRRHHRAKESHPPSISPLKSSQPGELPLRHALQAQRAVNGGVGRRRAASRRLSARDWRRRHGSSDVADGDHSKICDEAYTVRIAPARLRLDYALDEALHQVRVLLARGGIVPHGVCPAQAQWRSRSAQEARRKRARRAHCTHMSSANKRCAGPVCRPALACARKEAAHHK